MNSCKFESLKKKKKNCIVHSPATNSNYFTIFRCKIPRKQVSAFDQVTLKKKFKKKMGGRVDKTLQLFGPLQNKKKN